MNIMPSQSIVHPFSQITVMANSDNHSTPSPSTTPLISPSGDASASAINGREARNLAEKQRRDKLNASINELAKMVPHVADCPRRLDKTAVLRFATHGLRLQYVFGKSAAKRRPHFKGDNHNMTDTLLQLIDSFFITLTCHGQIVLISSSVEHLLGHCQSDLYGQNLLLVTHPEDQEMLRQQLIPSDIESLFVDMHNNSTAHYPQRQCSYDTTATTQHQQQQPNVHNVHHNPTDDNYLQQIDDQLRSDKRSFTVRLARASTRTESKKVYEIVKIDGCFRRSDFSAVATGANSYPIVSQLIRRSRNASNAHFGVGSGGSTIGSVGGSAAFIPHLLPHDAIAQAALHGVSGNDIVLVAMGRIIRPAKVINWPLEANRLEYKTRHLIDGRIIDCDHRIGIVAGYLQDEVRNLSPFSFMHQDDVRWVIVALRQMYDCNSDYGESCYRLLSRNGNFIYLQTKGYLEIDRTTNKVHSFVCINTLLDEEEGKRKVNEMKNKFSIIINAKVPTSTMQDATASQNPQQLERIVLYLIENLQKRQTNSCVVDEIHSEDDVKRHTNTPPLALVPPEPSSVKNSISKSVSVVISTAAKSLLLKSCSKQQSSESGKSSEKATSTADISTQSERECPTLQQRPSVLQMRDDMSEDDSFSITNTPESPQSAQQLEAPQHVSVLKRLFVDTTNKLPSTSSAHEAEEECQTSPLPMKRSNVMLSSSPLSSESSSSAVFSACTSPPALKTDSSSDIHHFISNSLEDVGESLTRIDTHATSLRQQCSNLPPALDNQLDAIIMEQQKQNDFLVNIKHEYDVYREQQECATSPSPNRTQQQKNRPPSSDNL